jgi:GNAT superfamily N-acetyltransferase
MREHGGVLEHPEYRLRAATHADARAIAEFQTTAWLDAYRGLVPDAYLDRMTVEDREQRWSERLLRGDRKVMLAVGATGRVIGVVSWIDGTEDGGRLPTVELATLYIHRDWYGSGIARALLDHALGSSAAWLWVFEHNARARTFYAKQGFQPSGEVQIDPDTGVAEVRLVRGPVGAIS